MNLRMGVRIAQLFFTIFSKKISFESSMHAHIVLLKLCFFFSVLFSSLNICFPLHLSTISNNERHFWFSRNTFFLFCHAKIFKLNVVDVFFNERNFTSSILIDECNLQNCGIEIDIVRCFVLVQIHLKCRKKPHQTNCSI